jgi:hypothetical protein
LLPALASLAAHDAGVPFNPATLPGATPWSIALAARESILWGNEDRKDALPKDYLRRLFNAAKNLSEPDLEDAADSAKALLSPLTRIAYSQFPFQESVYEELSRTHALLVEGAADLELEVLGGDDAWMEILGAPVGQSVGATFLLQVAANVNSGWFDPAWLDHPDLQPMFERWPRDVIEYRALQLSRTFDEFKAAYDQVHNPPAGYEPYAFNPLTARPFVRMPNGLLLAPQPSLILRTMTPGVLYHAGMSACGTAFARDLGKLTEKYVGTLPGAIDGEIALHPEVEYSHAKQNLRSTDWFLVLDSAVITFEVKSARFGLLDRATTEGYEERVSAPLKKVPRQLRITAERLDSRHPAFAHIPSDRPRIGISVTGEPFYLANSTCMRDLRATAPFPTLIASL